MNIEPKNLLETIAANVNNRKLTDHDFRQMVINSLKTHGPSQEVIKRFKKEQDNEIVNHAIKLNAPLLSLESSDIHVVYTHEQDLINNVKKSLDVYETNAEKDSIILDLSGFEDAESDEFNTLIELFGYENAEQIAGLKVQLIYLQEG